VKVRAEPGVDVILSLRAWLKRGLRDFGLRCVSVEEVTQTQEATMADMRKYGSGFIKPDDVRDAPLQAVIVNVYISEKYSRPVLELDTGDQFTVNNTNARVLIKAYGFEDTDWRGHTVKLSLGYYKDWNKDPPEEKETVTLEAVSSRDGPGANGSAQRIDPAKLPTLPKKPDDMDDSIPF
jgi:hypothetical protein